MLVTFAVVTTDVSACLFLLAERVDADGRVEGAEEDPNDDDASAR